MYYFAEVNTCDFFSILNKFIFIISSSQYQSSINAYKVIPRVGIMYYWLIHYIWLKKHLQMNVTSGNIIYLNGNCKNFLTFLKTSK